MAWHGPAPDLEARFHPVAKERLQLGRRLVVDRIRRIVNARVGKYAAHVRVEDLEGDVVTLPVEALRDRFQVCTNAANWNSISSFLSHSTLPFLLLLSDSSRCSVHLGEVCLSPYRKRSHYALEQGVVTRINQPVGDAASQGHQSTHRTRLSERL